MQALTSRVALPTRVTAMVVAIMVSSATPALAGSSSSYRVSGRSASTNWTQIDGTATGTSTVGNVHTGGMWVDETTKGKAAVFGYIEDWDCEEGETPGWGGHGGEFAFNEEPEPEPEPEDGFCAFIGVRIIESYNVPFTMDKKMGTARLTGRLTIYGGGHGDGGVVGRPQADVVWTGIGTTSTSRYTSNWRENGTWYSDTYRSSNRQATMSGILGPMGFDPDLSGGYLSTYKSSSRSRTK